MKPKANNAIQTSNQSIVNTATTKKVIGENAQIVEKKVYSEERFQIKNSGDLIDRKLQPSLSPEQMESIASTRPKLQYKKNSTYKLVNSYKVDYKWEMVKDEVTDRVERVKVTLPEEEHFRVGIYAVPRMHALV